MTQIVTGRSAGAICGFSVLLLTLVFFVLIVRSAFGQQPTPSPGSTIPTASSPDLPLKIEFNRRVRMRDGVELSADVYRPDLSGRFSVIINRTPYTKTSAGLLTLAKYFVSHGYVFVAMDVRGRGDSDGKFAPYVNSESLDEFFANILAMKNKSSAYCQSQGEPLKEPVAWYGQS